MKKLILTLSALMALAGSFAQSADENRCLDPLYHEKCATGAQSVFDDFVYLKSRPFSREMDGMLFELTLKQNTLYLFNTCEGGAANAIINLYTLDNDSVPIATTWNAEKNKNVRLLSYYSQASGRYLISVNFEKSKEYCVVVVCGMIRKNLETYVKLPPTK